MKGFITSNNKHKCPPYAGKCDIGQSCGYKCKKYYKKLGNRAIRSLNKKLVLQEILG